MVIRVGQLKKKKKTCRYDKYRGDEDTELDER